MLESLTEYWYMWVLLIAAIALMVFVWKKALAAAKKRRDVTYDSIAEMKFWNTLQKKYAFLDIETLESLSGRELYDAVLANIFAKLEKAKNDLEEYHSFSTPQKNIYATWFILEECVGGSVRKFCVNCMQTLQDISYESLYAIGDKKLGDIMKKVYDSFDEKNENLSFDRSTVEKFDAEIKRIFDTDRFISLAAEYILANKELFADSTSGELVC